MNQKRSATELQGKSRESRKNSSSGVTNSFIYNWLEWTDSASTMVKYYYAGSQRLAMRTGGSANTSLKWLLGDHPSTSLRTSLGSTSVTTDLDGDVISRTLYKPWGEIRYQSGTLPTQYTYTGQYSHTTDFGLMYYVARWYDPVLGRFAQADTLVPGAGHPLAWDRYAGMMNNPIRYSDPSGHLVCSDAHVAEGDCSDEGAGLWRFRNVTFSGKWSARNMELARQAIVAVAMKFAKELGGTLAGAFASVYGQLELVWDPTCAACGDGAYTPNSHKIVFGGLSQPGGNRTQDMADLNARNNVVHELGHAFAQKWWEYDAETKTSVYSPDGPYTNVPKELWNDEGFHPSPKSAKLTWQQHPCKGVADTTCRNEVFADMFLGWTFDTWANSPEGGVRDAFMTTNMAAWITALAR